MPRISATKRMSRDFGAARKKAPAGAQSGEEAVEGRESSVGVFCARELIEDERDV